MVAGPTALEPCESMEPVTAIFLPAAALLAIEMTPPEMPAEDGPTAGPWESRLWT